MTQSKHCLVTPHLKPNCKQVFVVRLIFHKLAWWWGGLGGGRMTHSKHGLVTPHFKDYIASRFLW